MKKKLFALLLVAVCAISCQNGIWDAIRDLEDKYTDLDGRVAKLEELCKEMNTNISSLQTLVSVILTNDYIISVTPITKDGKEIGYVITFAIHEPITIYHGQNGKDGANGEDGADGITPIIGVAQDETDHAYYWTLNGEWLLDEDGNRIPLTSRDGINGQDGTNGQDGITPRLKIENGYWFISYDNGVTWSQLGKAVGENGQDGKDGTNGQDGKDGEKGEKGDQGEPGYSMFTEVTQDDEFVYFTLYNGTILTVRKGNSTFDQTIIDNLVTSLTLDKEEIIIHNLSDRDTIIATTQPFANSKVIWSVSDSTIADVVGGIVFPKNWGYCTITAKAGDKHKTVSLYISGNTFSISATEKVYFSPGNLIKTSDNTYKFLSGGTVLSTEGWRSTYPSLPNPINYIENAAGTWRWLSSAEWNYLFNQRETINSRYRIFAINHYAYLIILPDNFVPLGELSTIDDVKFWERLGCACLCGTYNTNYYAYDSQRYSYGFYWTGTNNVYFRFDYNGSQPYFTSTESSEMIYGIRLVKDVE